jgi:hypothetical protein
VYKFATSPPDGVAPLVTGLWDEHLLPTWRERKDQSKKDKTPEDDAAVIEMIDRAQKESTPVEVDLDHPPEIDDFELPMSAGLSFRTRANGYASIRRRQRPTRADCFQDAMAGTTSVGWEIACVGENQIADALTDSDYYPEVGQCP